MEVHSREIQPVEPGMGGVQRIVRRRSKRSPLWLEPLLAPLGDPPAPTELAVERRGIERSAPHAQPMRIELIGEATRQQHIVRTVARARSDVPIPRLPPYIDQAILTSRRSQIAPQGSWL